MIVLKSDLWRWLATLAVTAQRNGGDDAWMQGYMAALADIAQLSGLATDAPKTSAWAGYHDAQRLRGMLGRMQP